MPTIYPSLPTSDIDALNQLIEQLDPYTTGYHIDVMDGQFVRPHGISMETITHITQKTTRQLWVHLMVENPKDYLDTLPLPGGSIVTFHIESKGGVLDVIKKITEKNWLPGLAINPETPVHEALQFCESLHQVTVMSVNPGYSGQPFLKDVESKIGPLVGFRQTSKSSFKIAMDGGIGLSNIEQLVQLGVDQFGIGDAIAGQKKPVEALQILQRRAEGV